MFTLVCVKTLFFLILLSYPSVSFLVQTPLISLFSFLLTLAFQAPDVDLRTSPNPWPSLHSFLFCQLGGQQILITCHVPRCVQCEGAVRLNCYLFDTRQLRSWASLVAQMVKHLPAVWETRVRSLGQKASPGEGNGNPLQYSCLENSMDGGAW